MKISDNSTVQDIWGVLVKYLTDKKFQTLLNNVSNLTSCWETGRTLTNGWELIPSVLVLLFAPPELLQHFMNNPRQTEAGSNSSCSSYIRNNIKRGEKERFYKVLDCLLGKILDKECKLWDPSVLILTLRFIDATPLNGTNFKRTDRFDRFEKILEIRESVFGYATSMSIPDDKFKALSDNIKHVAKALFREDDESRINDILNSKDHTEIENLNGTLEEQKVVSYDEIVYCKSMMAKHFAGMCIFHTYYFSTSLSNCFLNILTLHPCSHGIAPIYVMYLCSLVLSIVPLSLLDCLVKIEEIFGYSMNLGVIYRGPNR